MHIKNSKIRPLTFLLVMFLTLALTACGSANATATPTLSVDAIFTAAFQTLSVQQATQLASTPPTDTPAPTQSPTLAPPPTLSGGSLFGTSTSSSTGGTAGCNSSAFVKDVTIPDGTVINPGKSFVKTWAMQNTGTCAWSTSYKFTFITGDAMNGSSVAIPASVPAGQQVNISVTLTAPASSGNFKGYWRLQDDQGRYFGDSPWVAITVSGSTSTTGTATGATNTTAPTSNTPSTPTNTPEPPTATPDITPTT